MIHWIKLHLRALLLSLCGIAIIFTLTVTGYYILQNDTVVSQQTEQEQNSDELKKEDINQDTIDLKSTRSIDKEFGLALRSFENNTTTIEILVKTPSATQQLVAYAKNNIEEIRLGVLEKDEEDGSFVLSYSSTKNLSGNLQIHIKIVKI